ncbi:uncharacterized protein VP01_632g12 [Puccinia sorghi]|uniref:Phosphatidylethanolamine-binding protein n=1 Tax=Puccinia sorghi TaxID=27349 RepID=A0A0L6UH04_9BASI|nr:uncharacterized protein VP01_632g12 [Puccinia sorghi]
MANRPTRLTRSIIPVSQIPSPTLSRVHHQTKRSLSNSTATAATVKETKPNDRLSRGTEPPNPFPLKHSVEKAFQESMQYIKQDAERLQTKLKQMQLSRNPAQSSQEIERLEILTQVNDVQVRKNHKLGDPNQVDMSKPIYRFLEQQRWRKGGQLGRLSTNPPGIQVQVFHPEPKLYTLVMVDPDVPDPQNRTFTTFCHWMRTNISLSATTNGEVDPRPEKDEDEVLKYIPPHPAQGSGSHRYTIMMFEQAGPIGSGQAEPWERCGFSLRRFSSQHGLKPAGVMAWMSQWHERDAEAISAIYRDILQIPEPRYGKEPKPYSSRIKLPSHTPLPLTHRNPPVIPWRQKIASSADPSST